MTSAGMHDWDDLFLRPRSAQRANGAWAANEITLSDLLDRLHPSWHSSAACRGRTAEMFPETTAGVSKARQICAACPVRAECAASCVQEQFGMWGGLSMREREDLRKQRRVA